MLVPVLVVAGGKWCDPAASLCFILGRSSGPASPGATDRRCEAPRPGAGDIWRRNATRRWRDTAPSSGQLLLISPRSQQQQRCFTDTAAAIS